MKPIIAVDANPIISALIGGFSREVLFNHHFNFITTKYTLGEVERYFPYISKKADVQIEVLKSFLDLLPLVSYDFEKYEACLLKAKSLIKDVHDVDILALALSQNCPLWSNDKHFEGIKEIALIKTKDFV